MSIKKETQLTVEILCLLNELELSERITIIERIGKRLRQQNSIQTAKEVDQFTRNIGTKKQIDIYPV